ncbi:MAG TPA: PEP-CTERM sorting domain-containing protein [Fimbriimonas sp.]|nr:PEP-CTERM sorting domain-containing protein [Fimbriimonas sp.]
MKKAIILGSIALAASSNAAIVYDSIFTTAAQSTFHTLTNTGSVPRHTQGDNISLAALPANANAYRIDSLTFGVVNRSGSTYAGVLDVTATLFSTVTTGSSATTPVFSNPIVSGNLSYNMSAFGSGTGLANNTVGFLSVNFTNTFVNGVALTSPSLGVQFTTRINGVVVDTMPILLTTMPTGTQLYAGSSTNGFYRDASGDTILQQNEARTLGGVDSNVGLIVNATAVPEPASMIAIGLGIAGLAAKRRRKTA